MLLDSKFTKIYYKVNINAKNENQIKFEDEAFTLPYFNCTIDSVL